MRLSTVHFTSNIWFSVFLEAPLKHMVQHLLTLQEQAATLTW